MKEVCGPHTPCSLGFPRELSRAQHGLAGQASQAGQTGAKLGLAHGGRQVLVEMAGVGVGHPSTNTYSRVLHLDVEVRSEELLTPALLCHKEPARASKTNY